MFKFKLESLEERIRRKLLEWLLKDGLPEIKVGQNTVKIDSESVTLASLTADPTLAEGKLFFRGDLDELRFSPDGATTKTVYPSSLSEKSVKPKHLDNLNPDSVGDIQAGFDYVETEETKASYLDEKSYYSKVDWVDDYDFGSIDLGSVSEQDKKNYLYFSCEIKTDNDANYVHVRLLEDDVEVFSASTKSLTYQTKIFEKEQNGSHTYKTQARCEVSGLTCYLRNRYIKRRVKRNVFKVV